MDQPEQLLDAFKAAALSVTKLYKTSASAQAKARQEGYQDCLEELLAFLDRENIGLGDGEGWRIRSWATERLAAGSTDAMVQDRESEDEVEKTDRCSSPEISRSNSGTHLNSITERTQSVTLGSSAPKSEEVPASTTADSTTVTPTPATIAVPTQDQFTFQSSMSYPDAPNLATLNLSDSQAHPSATQTTTPHFTRQPRGRHNLGRPSARTSAAAAALGRGAGQKRKINFAEIFDLGSLGNGKDMFGNGKRSRHI